MCASRFAEQVASCSSMRSRVKALKRAECTAAGCCSCSKRRAQARYWLRPYMRACPRRSSCGCLSPLLLACARCIPWQVSAKPVNDMLVFHRYFETCCRHISLHDTGHCCDKHRRDIDHSEGGPLCHRCWLRQGARLPCVCWRRLAAGEQCCWLRHLGIREPSMPFVLHSQL